MKHQEEQQAAAKKEKTRLSLAWSKGRLSDDAYESRVRQIEAQEAQRQKRKEAIDKQLRSMRQVDYDGLDKIIASAAAQTSSTWEVDYIPDEVLERYQEKYTYQGNTYLATNPDTSLGRRIWDERRRLLIELGVKVYLNGREVKLSVNVPVQRADLQNYTKTVWSPSRATMSISP